MPLRALESTLHEATANHTQTRVRLLVATSFRPFSSLEGKRRSPSRSFSVVSPGRVCTSNQPTSILGVHSVGVSCDIIRRSMLKAKDRRFSDAALKVCGRKGYWPNLVVILWLEWRGGGGRGGLPLSAGTGCAAPPTCPCSRPKIYGDRTPVAYSIIVIVNLPPEE